MSEETQTKLGKIKTWNCAFAQKAIESFDYTENQRFSVSSLSGNGGKRR